MQVDGRLADEISSNVVSELEAPLSLASQSMQSPVQIDQESTDLPSGLSTVQAVESDDATNVVDAGDSGTQQEPLTGRASAVLEGIANSKSTSAGQPIKSVAAADGIALQQQLSQTLPGASSAEGLTVPTEASDLPARNNKLLALKQRRMGSLSSSLDLSCESSFDASAHPAALNEASSSLQNSFVPTEKTEDNTDLNRLASMAALPLDRTTGTVLSCTSA